MLTTSPLPMLGVSSQVHARRATFGGCGCQGGASVGASGSTSGTTSSSDSSSTTTLAVGLIAGAVLLLLIAAA